MAKLSSRMNQKKRIKVKILFDENQIYPWLVFFLMRVLLDLLGTAVRRVGSTRLADCLVLACGVLNSKLNILE